MKKTPTMKRILLSIGADPEKLKEFEKPCVMKLKGEKRNGK